MNVYISPLAPRSLLDLKKKIQATQTSVLHLEALPITHYPVSWELPASLEYNDYEWALNSFDTTKIDDVRLVPIRRDEPWETVEELARNSAPNLTLGIFPAILQLYNRFQSVMPKVGLPVCVVAPSQIEIIPTILKEMSVGNIVIPLSQFEKLQRVLDPAIRPSIHTSVILSPNEKCDKVPGGHVSYEMHIIPGIVGLFQCDHLTRQPEMVFHPSDRFVWEFEGDTVRVTDASEFQRFTRLAFPQKFVSKDAVCGCGRTKELSFV